MVSSDGAWKFWNFFSIRPSLGRIWNSGAADKAFRNGDLSSAKDSGGRLCIAFRNCTPLPLVLCWINEGGMPHHYYTVPPSAILDGPITAADHVENTVCGHAFCLALCEDVEREKSEGTLSNIIGGYRPSRKGYKDDAGIQLVTIRPGKSKCCSLDNDYELSVQVSVVDPKPLDTSDKVYQKTLLGGWPVMVEKDWHGGDHKLKRLYEDHFRAIVKCLPPHAREALKKNTPFYINKSQSYGPAACPIRGRGMCFHPDASWLKENGMCTDKRECVEIYKASDYKTDCKYWGPGGVLLHELSHAYHWKMVPGGYKNHEIQECYEAAMKEGLYECVKVHGSQGPTARAYACENCMEYFAELSVAFLAGKDKDVEYNKWQPFNRDELREFDPRAYKLLKKIWNVECDE